MYLLHEKNLIQMLPLMQQTKNSFHCYFYCNQILISYNLAKEIIWDEWNKKKALHLILHDLDPTLVDKLKPIQVLVALIYLSYLTEVNIHYIHRVWCETLKGYMELIAKYVHLHTGRDIDFQPNPNIPQTFWKLHFLITTIYKDTKEW